MILIALAAFSLLAAGQQNVSAQPYTAEQAAAGRISYRTNCAGCHAEDLRGRFEAPQLAGPNFMSIWGSQPPSALLMRIQTTMPPTNPGSLPTQDYVNVTAF